MLSTILKGSARAVVVGEARCLLRMAVVISGRLAVASMAVFAQIASGEAEMVGLRMSLVVLEPVSRLSPSPAHL